MAGAATEGPGSAHRPPRAPAAFPLSCRPSIPLHPPPRCPTSAAGPYPRHVQRESQARSPLQRRGTPRAPEDARPGAALRGQRGTTQRDPTDGRARARSRPRAAPVPARRPRAEGEGRAARRPRQGRAERRAGERPSEARRQAAGRRGQGRREAAAPYLQVKDLDGQRHPSPGGRASG